MVRAIEHQMGKENLLLCMYIYIYTYIYTHTHTHTHTHTYIYTHTYLYISYHIYIIYILYISSSATLFSPLPSIFPSVRVFSNDSALHIGMRWLDSISDSMDMNLSKLRERVKDREA